MKKILSFFLLLTSFLIPTFVFAAIDPATLKQIRQQRNQADYSAAIRSQVEKYGQSVESKVLRNQLMNQINATVSAGATVSDGSLVSSVSTISKTADASAAGSNILNRALKSPFTKGTAQSFVGAAAFAGLMKLLDVNQDQDHKFYQTPNPNDFTDPQNIQQGWVYQQPNFYTNYVAALNSILTSYNLTADKVNYYDISADHACADFRKNDGSWVVGGCVNYKVNPNYDSSKPGLDLTPKSLTQDQLLSKIIDYLQKNPTTDITNNIYIDAYSPDKTFSLSDDSVNGLAAAIGKQVADNIALAAQNSNGRSITTFPDGTVVDTSIDTSGQTGSGSSNSTTTINQDGSTTTNSTSSYEPPPFCTYASIVCDWIGWTKQEPDLQDTQLDIQDKTIDDYAYADHVVFGKTCPFQSPETVTLNLGIIGQITFQKDLTFMCTFADSARPYVIGLGYLGSFLYLLIALRNRNV